MNTDLGKVIRGLECCTAFDSKGFPLCEECPYADDGTCPGGLDQLHRDALELLKEQRPRLLKEDDFVEAELVAEKDRGTIITTEIEMLMKLAPCKIIGVTGSDGKTTTASLVYHILKEAGYNCYLGGNMGEPLFSRIYDIKPDDIVVLELSSLQLMNMKISPNISIITNIFEDHTKIHSSFEVPKNEKK